ncbi:MAG: arginine--tRNA ligase [Candidatus Atribacteria bacterium]|nr:arginine--tRNA ligase [Candidatus Atribacteria bacterium]
MFQTERQIIETKIKTFCAANGIPLAALEWKPIPFSGEWGFSTSFFATAAAEARLGKKVVVAQRAQEITEQVKSRVSDVPGIRRVEAVKGYLNLYFDTQEYTRRVVDTVLEQKNRFGSGPATGQRVMIEFSQPNTHKAFHVGHLRGTILGDAICRILEFAGNEVVRANYPGDMGLHVIKWLWGYLKFHNGEEPATDITKWMGEVYAEAAHRVEENPDLEAELRSLYARWDQRDPEIVALWERTREWSLEGFRQMYAALDVRFDVYYFNSQEEKPGKEVVEELVRRGIATDERAQGGAVIVKIDEVLGLNKEQFRTAVVLRSDGTALYSTEDLALALHKFRDYPDLAKSVYVVDVRQSLHFTQVFKILEIAGHAQAQKCSHVSYELVTLPGNVVVSSREGTVVLLEDLLREATTRARAEAHKKNPSLTEAQLESVAKAVGLGALKYPILARENTKMVTFDWQTALDFNGQAAPYIQYAHVRCNSILRKAGGLPDVGRSTFDYELNPAEIQLIDMISRFPGEVQRAAAEYKPLAIASIAYDIAKAFAGFYDACPVVQAEPQVRAARLRLVAATMQTLANSLALLGITAPEVM